jgi:hypothetical protein
MQYRVYVIGFDAAWDMVKFLGAKFTMTGRNHYSDPIFDCGVWHHSEIFGDERIAQWIELTLVRVWDT